MGSRFISGGSIRGRIKIPREQTKMRQKHDDLPVAFPKDVCHYSCWKPKGSAMQEVAIAPECGVSQNNRRLRFLSAGMDRT
jgi:hypothetical protein